MTHEERIALIHRPFPIRYLDASYPWAGTITTNQFARSIEDMAEENEELLAFLRTQREAMERGRSSWGASDRPVTAAAPVAMPTLRPTYAEGDWNTKRSDVLACYRTGMDAPATADYLGLPLKWVQNFYAIVRERR